MQGWGDVYQGQAVLIWQSSPTVFIIVQIRCAPGYQRPTPERYEELHWTSSPHIWTHTRTHTHPGERLEQKLWIISIFYKFKCILDQIRGSVSLQNSDIWQLEEIKKLISIIQN